MIPMQALRSPTKTSLFRNAHRCIQKALTFMGAALLTVMLSCPVLHGQTIEDGIMVAKRSVTATALYSHDSWDHYWEGSLNRINGNVGTVTTQMATLTGNYGLTNRLNILAGVPYVWTHASQGTLHGQSGFQDLTLAVKYNALQLRVGDFGGLRLIGLVTGAIPLTDYTPDLQPLSLGTHSRRIGGRLTMNFQGRQGLYVNGSAAYTVRGNVKLDRSSYYTNGQLYLSDEVAMPNLFNYILSAGYRKKNMMFVGNFAQQQARGGGDIRRQDLPFVSNRTNFSQAGATVLYPMPGLRTLQYTFTYANTFEGRNVGQANTFTAGLMYTLHFERQGSK